MSLLYKAYEQFFKKIISECKLSQDVLLCLPTHTTTLGDAQKVAIRPARGQLNMGN